MSEQETQDGAAAVQEDLEALRTRAQERDQFLEPLTRPQADFANYPKPTAAGQQERPRRSSAQDLLPVIDNLNAMPRASEQ